MLNWHSVTLGRNILENRFRVAITKRAYEDLDSIYGYIKNDLKNENVALDLIDEIEKSILRLKDYPYSCCLVEDDKLKDQGYRKLIVKNYITFYLVSDEEKVVSIMRILYGRQDYKNMI